MSIERPKRKRGFSLRLLCAIGFFLLIVPCGPLVWFVICAVHAGGLSSLLNSVVEWEEFSYKWPAACWISTIIALVVSLRIMLSEEHAKESVWSLRRALTWIVLPGLVILGVAYGVMAVYDRWLGVILGLGFICYLLWLLVILGRRGN